MKTITTFLTEAPAKKDLKPVVMVFGRMNPPTTGHKVLVDKVHELAKKHNAHHEVILSHSQDAEKNPLSQEAKIAHAKKYFPGTNITGSSKESPNFISHAKRLSNAGHKHLIMVAGEDRVKEYKDTLKRYNGKEFNFDKIQVVSAGARDPDAEGVEGMSASKMRSHAKRKNFTAFRKGVPKHVSTKDAKALYGDVRRGMGLKESLMIEGRYRIFTKDGFHPKHHSDLAKATEAMKLHHVMSGGKPVSVYDSKEKRTVASTIDRDMKESEILDVPTMTVDQIAKKHGVSIDKIEAQLKMGIEVEKEHTKDEKTAREIALDHLSEKPDYYTKLKKMVEQSLNTQEYPIGEHIMTETMDDLVEVYLFGTDAARVGYAKMTPGEPEYVEHAKKSVAENEAGTEKERTSAREAKGVKAASQAKTKTQKEGVLTQEAKMNVTYERGHWEPGHHELLHTHIDMGDEKPKTPERVGHLIKTSDKHKTLTDAGWRYHSPGHSSGFSHTKIVKEDMKVDADSVKRWATKPETIKMFREKYGPKATEKLIETTKHMEKRLTEGAYSKMMNAVNKGRVAAGQKSVNLAKPEKKADDTPKKTLREVKAKIMGIKELADNEGPPVTGYAKQERGE